MCMFLRLIVCGQTNPPSDFLEVDSSMTRTSYGGPFSPEASGLARSSPDASGLGKEAREFAELQAGVRGIPA